MIHVIEEFVDVRPPHPPTRKRAQKFLRTVKRRMETLALSAGPDIMQERAIVELNELIVEETVHETITHGCDGDHATLRIAHLEYSVGAMAVCPAREVVLEREEMLLEVVRKVLESLCPLLPGAESLPAVPESR